MGKINRLIYEQINMPCPLLIFISGFLLRDSSVLKRKLVSIGLLILNIFNGKQFVLTYAYARKNIHSTK